MKIVLHNRPVACTAAMVFLAAFAADVSARVTATGGNVTNEAGGYRIHTFTTNGAFTVTVSGSVDVLVVAGGGGGGGYVGGGGGAGGVIYTAGLAIATGVVNVTVGAGGAGGANAGYTGFGGYGSNSVFSSMTAIGGGRGGAAYVTNSGSGGSGGGAGSSLGNALELGQTGTAGQGNNGGNSAPNQNYGAGGGGGGGGPGANGTTTKGGDGGVGVTNSISGSAVVYGGGGGGAGYSGTNPTGGLGGDGGGGKAGNPGTNGTANTGGGGGGGGVNSATSTGGAGGSGVVIVRYQIPTNLTVDVLAPSVIKAAWATVNGTLICDGGDSNTTVYFCWDYSDGGTNGTSAWANVTYGGTNWGTGDSFSTNIAGLLSGSNYTYRCFATNTSGFAWSESSNAFAAVALPVLTNPGATAIYDGTAVLRGEVTSTGGETPNAWFEYWLAGSASTTTCAMGLQGGSFSNSISGLLYNSAYQYRVKASNDAGIVWSAVSSFSTALWFINDPGGKRMRIRVTIPVTEPLTNFPLLVYLGTSISNFDYSQFTFPANGADLRFANSNETVELPYDIELWDTSGISAVWVKLPLVEGTNTTFYAYWHNNASPSANPAPVWDDTFATVWHLSDTNGVQHDSTTNAKHAWLYPNGQSDITSPGMDCVDNMANGAPGNLIDNNTGTEAYEATTTARYWRVDLGAGTSRVASLFRYYAGWQSKDFTIQGSINDTDWVAVYSNRFFNYAFLWQTFGFQNTNAYRYYRLNFLNYYAAGPDPCEIEFFEPALPTTRVNGVVAGCQDFDGVSNELNAIRPITLPRTNISVSCWSKHDVASAANDGLMGTSGSVGWNNGFGFYYAAANTLYFWVNQYNVASNNVIATVTATNWNHFYGTYNGTILALYVNGQLRNIETNSAVVPDSSWWFLLGRMADPSGGHPYDYDGKLDEVRLENVGRSSNWIWACWFNQASNSSFVTYDAVTAGALSTSGTLFMFH